MAAQISKDTGKPVNHKRIERIMRENDLHTKYHTPRELRQLINQYVDDYNGIRPHEALGYEVPDKLYFNRFAA